MYTDYVGLDNWNYQKKLSKMLRLTDLSAFEKTGQFGLLFVLETLNCCLWLDSNPRPCASQPVTLPTIPNFLMKIFSKFLSQMLKYFYNLSVSESPVGSSCNRRFRLKRQKTKNAYIFWPRPNFFMKFSEMYRTNIERRSLCSLLAMILRKKLSTPVWLSLHLQRLTISIINAFY